MEALLVGHLPEGHQWRYEPKWDGFRAVIFRDGDEVDAGADKQGDGNRGENRDTEGKRGDGDRADRAPDPLPAREERVAHGLLQPARALLGREAEPGEVLVDHHGVGGEGERPQDGPGSVVCGVC
jgi:hypothetical protein